jgi:hypothetical protein
MTLKEMYSQVVADAGVLGNRSFPYQRIVKIINDAQKIVQTELNGLGFKYAEKGESLNLDNSNYNGVQVSRSPIPSVLESPDSILYISTEATTPGSILIAEDDEIIITEDDEEVTITESSKFGISRAVEPIEFSEIIGNGYLIPTVVEPRFMRLANYIYIYPRVNNAYIYYYQSVPDLVEESDVSIIPSNFVSFIIKKAVADIKGILGDLNAKQQSMMQSKVELSDAYKNFITTQKERNRIKEDVVLQ